MTDPFVHDDGAYVLGALSADEQAAFEAHLRTCTDCAARVHEIENVPALLSGITLDEIVEPAPPMPQTLLPMLLRRAAVRQRRTRWLVGSLAAVAAAVVIALVVVVWPTSSSAPRTGPTHTFAALVDTPVVATASLTPKPWGTQIDVKCVYRGTSADRGIDYFMYVYDRTGSKQAVGGWLQPDHDINYRTGTTFTAAQIAKVEITLPNGTPILRLRT